MVLLNDQSPSRSDSYQKLVKKKSERCKGGRLSRGCSPSDKHSNNRRSSPSGGSIAKGKSPTLSSRGSECGSTARLNDVDRRSNSSKSAMLEDNINVVVRVRPLSNKEIKTGDDMAVQFPGDGQIYCDALPNSGEKKARLFSYNVVFEPAATQEDILLYSGIKRLIEMAVEGFNCTAFCYGQTGSGKTHTLTGPPGLFDNMDPYSEDHGLVFRSFVYLFKILQERHEFSFVLKASFLEIYNEKVIDLLNPGNSRKSLAVRWSKKSRGFFVENLFTVECEELDDLLAVLEEGMRNRSVGAHNMNEYSSRSHSILTVHITSEQQMENGVFISKQGKINFVDLAGSEMTKKTQSEGKTLEEANNINKSLMVLGYCISSLSDGKRKSGHIPYRDSKLTKLLADSLAGNGVTLMIACISPARSNASETLNTLRYAARAKKIRTKPIVVMDPREALILSLKREVGALQMENDHLRSALNLESHSIIRAASKVEKQIPITPPDVDLDKLAELESSELSQLIRAYVIENEALRRENAELYATREQVIRDQELVCKENERLLRKLEDVNSVCCRSPIIPARPTYSSEVLNDANNDDVPGATNIWTNPEAEPHPPSFSVAKVHATGSAGSKFDGRVPEKILKELDKRRIMGSFNNIAEAYKDKSHHRRHNSWDNSNGSSYNRDTSPIEPNNSRRVPLRRTSTVPEEKSRSIIREIPGRTFLASGSLTGTPESVKSGPLEEGNSTPDSAESVAPTAPFPPPVCNSSASLDDSVSLSRTSRRGLISSTDDNDSDAHRAFGSPVSIDDDATHF